ncbi:class I SAM-dependent methyltransferase [Paenibacillus sp. J2TS4]|uniref:class I SAM-dependent DNA methyltransferase n=1 Tax=Paenibacillus sp. J2TS4 TaxID=2807194 RepID=UPI001B228588|nr:class I SAM-dependent methyltransferase [Paenibacillus sp. J2TS4]GIP35884.1 methyltransferase [Paenibacillus sp. J2TS4]
MAYQQFANYYDRLMEDMPYADWLRFVGQCWERYGRPASIVDLGCGTGNLTIPLARDGFQVTGIDLSEDMLAVARSKSEGSSCTGGSNRGSVQWIQQDMVEWELPHAVDAVVSFCDCFNYLLEEDSLRSAFRSTYQGLTSGGLFVFDVHTPFQLQSYAKHQPFVLNEEDIAYLWTCQWDEEWCEIEHELAIFVKEDPQDRSSLNRYIRVDETHIQRAYPLDKIAGMLRQEGFAQVECFADFTWKPVEEETERAFFVAKK